VSADTIILVAIFALGFGAYLFSRSRQKRATGQIDERRAQRRMWGVLAGGVVFLLDLALFRLYDAAAHH